MWRTKIKYIYRVFHYLNLSFRLGYPNQIFHDMTNTSEFKTFQYYLYSSILYRLICCLDIRSIFESLYASVFEDKLLHSKILSLHVPLNRSSHTQLLHVDLGTFMRWPCWYSWPLYTHFGGGLSLFLVDSEMKLFLMTH